MSELKKMSLEEMMIKLQEIQQSIEQKKVNLTESIPMLELATKLRNEIMYRLNEMENKLVTLSNNSENTEKNK